MINIKSTRLSREKVFTYVTDDDQVFHFAADRIRNWCKMTGQCAGWVALTEQLATRIERGHGLEPERLAAIRGPIREPALFVMFDDTSGTCIDGNHRCTVAYRRGEPRIMAYMVPRRVWEVFLIDLGEHDKTADFWRQDCRSRHSNMQPGVDY